jgi:hypothetical protein
MTLGHDNNLITPFGVQIIVTLTGTNKIFAKISVHCAAVRWAKSFGTNIVL